MGLQQSRAQGSGNGSRRGNEEWGTSSSSSSTRRQQEEQQAPWAYTREEDEGCVGVVVIGLGQRMLTLLQFLLHEHGGGRHYVPKTHRPRGIVEIRALCDDAPEALRVGKECIRYFSFFLFVYSIHLFSIYFFCRNNTKMALFRMTLGLDLEDVPCFTSHDELFSAGLDFSWVLVGSKNYLHKVC